MTFVIAIVVQINVSNVPSFFPMLVKHKHVFLLISMLQFFCKVFICLDLYSLNNVAFLNFENKSLNQRILGINESRYLAVHIMYFYPLPFEAIHKIVP